MNNLLSVDEKRAIVTFKTRMSERFKNQLLEIKIFGSKARGDSGVDSDIDVLVTLKKSDWKTADSVYEIASDVLLETGIHLCPKVLSEGSIKKLREMNTTFFQNVTRDGISV